MGTGGLSIHCKVCNANITWSRGECMACRWRTNWLSRKAAEIDASPPEPVPECEAPSPSESDLFFLRVIGIGWPK